MDKKKMRCAIVLGEGKYEDEFAGYSGEPGPRLEFIEIAKALDADVISYCSAAASRGAPFTSLFGRYKKVGSAMNAAMLAANYDRLYVTAEGVGLPLAILLKARRWKGKIACVFHNMSWPTKKRVMAWLGHEMFCALITVNRRQAEILTAECGMPTAKVIPVFNWVDDKFFSPHHVAKSVSMPFVMACGAENRDYDTLARAADRIKVNVAVYGHGFLAENRKAKNSSPNLNYMARVSYPELRDAYSACSIVVVPLNDVAYAAGVTGIVEGMAAGRPMIVTASRGIEEYIAAFDPVTVVRPGDDQGMALAIDRLQHDESMRQRLGQQNRLLAEEKCSVDKYAAMVAARMAAI
ncbi:glycosyltransferase [Variovorax sp. LT1P1]|uniref:glycosyltransferase n=1 Tax=Variovorax sp. LT1P1 TaxID=3443730 RepID=UPI003F462F7E